MCVGGVGCTEDHTQDHTPGEVKSWLESQRVQESLPAPCPPPRLVEPSFQGWVLTCQSEKRTENS